jgi:hypothetical protein
MTMATNRKRIPRSRKDTGLTSAEEMFVYGKTEKHVNPFEELGLEYPQTDKEKAKILDLQRFKESI